MTQEAEVHCPYCGELFSIIVDCSEPDQMYIEDCFVCCRPIQFHILCSDGEVIEIRSDRDK